MRFISMTLLAFIASIISLSSIAKQPLNIELTPLIGYRFGGDFDSSPNESNNRIKLTEETSYGLLTAWSFDETRQGEFLISHYNSTFEEPANFSVNNTKLSITYAHLGGNVPIVEAPFPFYFTGGLGFTHFAPEGATLDNETRFSVNVGLATKIELNEHFSLRLDSRVYGTFFNSDSEIFCDTGACSVYISSNVWVQTEVSAGLTYHF